MTFITGIILLKTFFRYAVGWSFKSVDERSIPNMLNNIKLIIYRSDECESSSFGYTQHWDSQICAGDLSGLKSSCDSKL